LEKQISVIKFHDVFYITWKRTEITYCPTGPMLTYRHTRLHIPVVQVKVMKLVDDDFNVKHKTTSYNVRTNCECWMRYGNHN